jgi:hypothetical protein
MSSTNVCSVLSQLLSEMKTLNGRISSLETLISVKPSAAPAPKKERKSAPKSSDSEPRAPTAWRLFADRVRGVLREAGFEGKSLGTECVQFCSSLKEEKADFSSWSESDILARRAAWSAPEVSKQKAKSSPPSVASEAEAEAEAAPAKKARKNPWEGLSEEQKAERIAKMKAGKAAKKASEASAPDAEEEAPASDVEAAPASVSSSEKKKRQWSPEAKLRAAEKRAAKKEVKSAAPAASASAAAKMPLPPSPPSSVSALEGFQRVMLSGSAYWVNLQNGHCYHRLTDGSQGDWAGIFSRTPKPHIDSSKPEPSDELVFTDVDEVD